MGHVMKASLVSRPLLPSGTTPSILRFLERMKDHWECQMNASPIGRGRSVLAGFLVAVVVAAVGLPTVAHGQVCNGNVTLQQFDPAECSTTTSPCIIGELDQAILVVGQTVRVQLTLGAGPISGTGTPALTVRKVRFDLDCQAPAAFGTFCTDQGAVIAYAGDSTIASDCGNILGLPRLTFATNNPGGGTAINELVFTPSTNMVIPANNGCHLNFNLTLANPEPQAPAALSDNTPSAIEEF